MAPFQVPTDPWYVFNCPRVVRFDCPPRAEKLIVRAVRRIERDAGNDDRRAQRDRRGVIDAVRGHAMVSPVYQGHSRARGETFGGQRRREQVGKSPQVEWAGASSGSWPPQWLSSTANDVQTLTWLGSSAVERGTHKP